MDKWKRIIEPAGDSESSDWSSEDSATTYEFTPFRIRPLFNSKRRSQEGRSNSQNQVDPAEDCWQDFSPDYRSQTKKRCLSNVSQVNVNCSSTVVTHDTSNEESSNIEPDKERSGLYSSGNRSWGIESDNSFLVHRRIGLLKQNCFNGPSTSYQVPESGNHTSIAGRNSPHSSRHSRELFSGSEPDGQPSCDNDGNKDIAEKRDDISSEVIVDASNVEDKAIEDQNDNTKEAPTDVQLQGGTDDDSNQQREIVELPNMELNQSLISLLECPVCLEYVFPPINQCKRGHLVCANCKPQLNNCPTCRSRFTETRNLAMEQVAEKLYYPCRNHTSGCKGMYLLQDKKEHEANCHYRTYKCIVSHCMWKGFKPDILGHMVDVHKKIVVYGENQVLKIKLDTCVHFTQNWIVSAFGQVFRVNFLVSYLRSQIAGCVQYLGPRKYASDYLYTFDVCTNTRRLLYSRQTHGDSGRLMTLYNTGDCFFLRTDAANYYVSEKVIKVKLQIKKIINGSAINETSE